MMQELMPEFFTQNSSEKNAEDNAGSTPDAENAPFGINLSEISQMMDMIQEFRKLN